MFRGFARLAVYISALAGCSAEALPTVEAVQDEAPSTPTTESELVGHDIDVDAALSPRTRSDLAELMGDVDEEVQAYTSYIGRFPDESANVEALAGVDSAATEAVVADLQAAYPEQDYERLFDVGSRYVYEIIQQEFEELRARQLPISLEGKVH